MFEPDPSLVGFVFEVDQLFVNHVVLLVIVRYLFVFELELKVVVSVGQGHQVVDQIVLHMLVVCLWFELQVKME